MNAEGHHDKRLAEERRLERVLRGSLVVGAILLIAFVGLTIFKWASRPADVTADWFSAWGTWVGGFAAATAFLIAALSISVASAHARVDRHVAADIRADDEMAQARLLAVYKVDIPGAFPGLATFRIENRSQQCVFDVKVPYADVPSGASGTGPAERRTPEAVEADGRLHEYLPTADMLTPYLQSTTHEGWFTEMTLHTREWERVAFAVDYTDASGRRWRQHYGGRIERLLTDQTPLVKKADRFQTGYQISLISDEEARARGGLFARHLPPLESDEEFLQALGLDVVSSWRRVEHKRSPDIRPSRDHPGDVTIEMPFSPTAPTWWNEHLKGRLREFGFGETLMRSVGEHASIRLRCAEDNAAAVIGQIHDAIEFANDQFEAIELAAARRALVARDADTHARAEHQRKLNDTARSASPHPPAPPDPRSRGDQA